MGRGRGRVGFLSAWAAMSAVERLVQPDQVGVKHWGCSIMPIEARCTLCTLHAANCKQASACNSLPLKYLPSPFPELGSEL